MTYKKSRYTDKELQKALDLIEKGYTMSEVIVDSNLNKSIVAREIRKRKNKKALQQS
jgi:hypothetical protein